MKNLQYVIPDTSEPLSNDELEMLEFIDKEGGYFPLHHHPSTTLNNDLVEKMINEGKLNSFRTTDNVYVFLPDVCRMQTFVFKLPKIEMVTRNGKLQPSNDHFKELRRYLRTFIENWIYGKGNISDNLYIYYLQLYTFRTPCLLSIPIFLIETFMADAKKATLMLKEISPKFKSLRCNMCGERFETTIQAPQVKCPKCQSPVSNE